jgi:hypothetical protein
MTDTPVSDPFFVIFDTCTHAAYYGDVHEVLALPAGAIVRYEYKRYLFKPEAAATLDGFANAPCRFPPRFDPGFPLRTDPA